MLPVIMSIPRGTISFFSYWIRWDAMLQWSWEVTIRYGGCYCTCCTAGDSRDGCCHTEWERNIDAEGMMCSSGASSKRVVGTKRRWPQRKRQTWIVREREREWTGTEAGRGILDQIPSTAADYHLIHLLSANDVVKYISVPVVHARDRKKGNELGSRSKLYRPISGNHDAEMWVNVFLVSLSCPTRIPNDETSFLFECGGQIASAIG